MRNMRNKGIVSAAAFILLIFGVAFLLITSADVFAGLRASAEFKKSPKISSILPFLGPAGTEITLGGTGFTSDGNSIFIRGRIVVTGLSSPDGASLVFPFPSNTLCLPDEACPIKVINSKGISNAAIFRLSKGDRSHRKPINITNPSSALTNYQVLVTLDTASLISAGKMQADCDDVRATGSDGTTLINHWLESGCNSANTKIWVQVPSIPTNGTTIYIYYGNTTAATGSNFTDTFPSRYILTSGSDTATGPQNYDWFEVQSGATFNTQDETSQSITARKILIAGTVNGASRGFDGASSIGTGQGSGAGSHKSGGAYGGAGGQGFTSAWGAGGTPGSAYGSASSGAIQMGSGGGASDNIQAPGGDGGGAVTFNSTEIVISGSVTMSGGSHGTGTNQNGGGAGGGILILASRVNLSGSLSVNGGGADGGTVRAGGAGGGGGGRIKIFRDESISDTSTKNINGGIGSPGGTNGGSLNPGGAGAAGTTFTGTFTSLEPTISIGGEESVL